jgi:hypothetical protein
MLPFTSFAASTAFRRFGMIPASENEGVRPSFCRFYFGIFQKKPQLTERLMSEAQDAIGEK